MWASFFFFLKLISNFFHGQTKIFWKKCIFLNCGKSFEFYVGLLCYWTKWLLYSKLFWIKSAVGIFRHFWPFLSISNFLHISQCNLCRFEMMVLDNFGNEVIHFRRPLASSSCLFPCCLQSLTVTSRGQFLGKVEQEWSCLPQYRVRNHSNETVLRIEGPFCTDPCCGDVIFKVTRSKLCNSLSISAYKFFI